MIHTKTLASLALPLLLGTALVSQVAPKARKSAQDPEVKKIIDSLKLREKALKGATLEMTTVGSYPSGLEFRTRGSVRVLGTTHFDIRVTSLFGDSEDLRSELHKVVTPEGVWTYQNGPVDDVYTHTDKDLMNRLRVAERALASDKEATMRNPGPLAGQGEAVLGSGMLEALDLQFGLEVEAETRKLGATECRVIRGDWRGFRGLAAPESTDYPRGVVRVEIFVRAEDGIPIKMVQYDRSKVVDGKSVEAEALVLEIRNLVIDPPLDPKSFELKVPEGIVFKPVMEHRASRAQINRIFEEYEALQQDAKSKKKQNQKRNG